MKGIYLVLIAVILAVLGLGLAPASPAKPKAAVQLPPSAKASLSSEPGQPKPTQSQTVKPAVLAKTSPVKAPTARPDFGIRVDVTYYQALRGQTDTDPHTSACGPNLKPWVQVALSRDLFISGNGSRRCGQRVRLRFSNGEELIGVVNDTMNRRFRNRVDVLVHNHQNAWALGREIAHLEWM